VQSKPVYHLHCNLSRQSRYVVIPSLSTLEIHVGHYKAIYKFTYFTSLLLVICLLLILFVTDRLGHCYWAVIQPGDCMLLQLQLQLYLRMVHSVWLPQFLRVWTNNLEQTSIGSAKHRH